MLRSSAHRTGLTLKKYHNCQWLSASHISTVQQGVAFERQSLMVLQQTMSMSLRRVGGKEDGGVDLIGWWWLPEMSAGEYQLTEPQTTSLSRRHRLRVVGQCKAEKKKMGPNYVRELEGVLYRFMTNPLGQNQHWAPEDDETLANTPRNGVQTVALLISQSSFTKSTLLRASSSSIPFLLLHLPSVGSEDEASALPSNVGTAWCNSALCGTHGLFRGRMEVRWERCSGSTGGRPALWWDGTRLSSWTPQRDYPSSDASHNSG